MPTLNEVGREALEYYSRFLPKAWVICCLEELTPEQKRRREMPVKIKVYQIPRLDA